MSKQRTPADIEARRLTKKLLKLSWRKVRMFMADNKLFHTLDAAKSFAHKLARVTGDGINVFRVDVPASLTAKRLCGVCPSDSAESEPAVKIA